MIILFILAAVIIIMLVFIIILAINSPGRLSTKVGRRQPNGLAEKVKMKIGGLEQGMFILGEDKNNPVLLFLHGGPGSPALPIIGVEGYEEKIEKNFTVCYWDQRGAGMSYYKDMDTRTMTVEQMVNDTHEVTQYLKKRFHKEKIYLMGHSWGTYLGVKAIEKYPQDYIAYIGMGQISDQIKSEKLAYDYMLKHAEQINDKKAMKELKKHDRNSPDFPQFSYIMGSRSKYLNKYGIGVVHKKASMLANLKQVKQIMLFKGYTLNEKIKFIRGILFSIELFDEVLKDNFFINSKTFEIPFFITQGKYDYQVSYQLAKQYLEIISAPQKKFFTFEDSAHSPIIEERDLFYNTIEEIRDICGDAVSIQASLYA